MRAGFVPIIIRSSTTVEPTIVFANNTFIRTVFFVTQNRNDNKIEHRVHNTLLLISEFAKILTIYAYCQDTPTTTSVHIIQSY